MKTYDEMKKEVDAMPKGAKKTVMKKIIKNIRDAENLQKKYEKIKDKLPEEERNFFK